MRSATRKDRRIPRSQIVAGQHVVQLDERALNALIHEIGRFLATRVDLCNTFAVPANSRRRTAPDWRPSRSNPASALHSWLGSWGTGFSGRPSTPDRIQACASCDWRGNHQEQSEALIKLRDLAVPRLIAAFLPMANQTISATSRAPSRRLHQKTARRAAVVNWTRTLRSQAGGVEPVRSEWFRAFAEMFESCVLHPRIRRNEPRP